MHGQLLNLYRNIDNLDVTRSLDASECRERGYSYVSTSFPPDSDTSNSEMPRHEDAGPVMSPLTRSSSGRLPPAYHPWNRRTEPNNENIVQTDPSLENTSHESTVLYNADQPQHDLQDPTMPYTLLSLGEETEKGGYLS